jgi:hypothetical protein
MDGTVKANLSIDIDVQRLRDLLCSAVEGGSNYWARFSHSQRTPEYDYLSVRVQEDDAHSDNKPAVDRVVTAEDLVVGLEALAKGPFPAARQHLSAFLEENDDAETADVVLQMTVFGELVYG